ncbi:SDR family oxidoreductase [Spongisporangium articulatum]|uniref:SDR family oxidoreductase n=1 Tax=Spongisporangium articulatum TaxID=3362603 RepID=A0ABW8AKE1_9ACTN
MILITSAAGGVGRPLVRDLSQRGLPVRAFVKNEQQARLVRNAGATEVVVGDLKRPGDLEAAVAGARQLYHAAPTQIIDEVPIARRLIAAAGENGVEHLLFHSVIHPEIPELTHHHQKLLVEGLLKESGLPVTVLRPSHYMQNYLDFWDLLQAGILTYPFSPDRIMGVVDVEDVAQAALEVLLAPESHLGQTYDLSTQALDRHQMARIWSRVLGHPVTAIRLPPDALNNPLAAAGALGPAVVRSLARTGLRSTPALARGLVRAPNARGVRGWPEDAREAYVRMLTYYDGHGLPPGDLTHLPALLGRAPTEYADFARREAAVRGAVR